MNNSTQNVTLFAAFINDVLNLYKDKKDDYAELFEMTKDLDLSDPFNKVPMEIYNKMCQWLEDNLGKFNLIKVGRQIGETAYGAMVQNKLITESSSPQEVAEGLVIVAANMIQDPEGRGWVIVEKGDKHLIMRRTQTFNSKLQLGLLDGLIRKSGVSAVKVEYVNEIELGAEFDDYKISWV
ncbi:MAG: hypothetical protein ACXITV_00380 [Luteibaculaceae bacterium]